MELAQPGGCVGLEEVLKLGGDEGDEASTMLSYQEWEWGVGSGELWEKGFEGFEGGEGDLAAAEPGAKDLHEAADVVERENAVGVDDGF